jgi:glycosyltransferase involved in cell wall biosynthesis
MNFLRRLVRKKKRSVVFYRQSYYHFYYLARALRKRGWDAIVVNVDPKNGVNASYYHGEDLNLHHDNPKKFNKNIKRFLKKATSRFKLMHFSGDGYLTFYPRFIGKDEEPKDIIAWKKAQNKVAYTVSGCNSGTSKEQVAAWSSARDGLNVCDRCIWQDRHDVCNSQNSLAWGEKIHKYCDLMFAETSPAIGYMRAHEKVVRDPTTMCLDSEVWSPGLNIPEKHIIEKEADEILIYHAVGNYDTRNSDVKNIKGTPYIFEAVEQLKTDGYPVKLLFLTDTPSHEVRYYQAQADIIVDQLNYGRYGATAREGMMLGKPVICYINIFEYREEDQLSCLDECPLVSATEADVYEVLKNLVVNASLRVSVGEQSRAYALKWHSADACAERYEKIYDRLFDA